ncbi:hypothetical protein CONLIGDRAFT_234714 [Coniochaeta ligniaria NRRL 30616]|uniref:Extracellular membrane protein CFEM domain-containing protein n=1 Tax=Coniochaeta ligniaria NRRL 30616 TaxID=1408157 RepID=A0A1J7IWI9_9PEZI|nr:hypothetical protein CONLIGDRAFT_234714 [Coniochaeta ligniaria NRRL 30616]
MAPSSRTCNRATRQVRHHTLAVSLLLLSTIFAKYAAATPPITPFTNAHDSDKHDPKTQVQLTETSSTQAVEEPPAAHNLVPRDQQTPGSSCPGSEGQWNCMTNSWQRCAAGRWSVVMQCAAGTACTPAGLTYDFKVQFSGQGTSSGSFAPRAVSLPLLWPVLLMAAGVTTTVLLCL